MERVCVETIESGAMTKDLALAIYGKDRLKRTHYLESQTFLDVIKRNFDQVLAGGKREVPQKQKPKKRMNLLKDH